MPSRLAWGGARAPIFVLALALPFAAAQQDTLDEALDEASGSARDGALAQAQIDRVADETTELVTEYRLRSQELKRLDDYNRHLEALVADQERRLAEMDDELAGALVVQQEIVPLMYAMLDNLAAFVAADMPILREERSARVGRLRDLMSDSDVTTAEKYRLIMEAYQIELDIGRKVGTYTGTIERDGQTQSVNFLYVGRVLLAYQTEDRSQTAFWNVNASPPGWERLTDDYRVHVDNAMRIANRQAAGDLLRLPVPAPEAAR